MDMIADIFLAAGALGAAIYCVVLAGRLKRFNNLQNGVGGAVAVLSAQVDDMTKTLQSAQKTAATSAATLTSLTERAEDVSRRLELMLASMHDLPDQTQAVKPAQTTMMPESPKTYEKSKPKVPIKKKEPTSKAFFSSKRPHILEAAE